MTNIGVYSCGGVLFLKKKYECWENYRDCFNFVQGEDINMRYRHFTRLKIYGNKNWVSAAVSSKGPEVGLGAAKFQ